MVQLKSLFAALLTAVTLQLDVSARDCYTNDTYDPIEDTRWLNLTQPEQLDALNGCTKLIGSIIIDPAFSGSIVLKGVEEFEGGVGSTDAADVDSLDAIEFPDLRGLHWLSVYGNGTINRLSFPRLEAIGIMDLRGPRIESFDMGSLQYAWVIALEGSWTNISFPSLEEAELSIHHTWPDAPLAERDRPPMDIHLPVLRKADNIDISGFFRSLRVPSLEQIDGLTVHAQDPDFLGVDLPSLTSCFDSMIYTGYIERVDLGPLKKMTYSISIVTKVSVEITSSIQEGGEIYISGPVKTLNFSNITRARELKINTTSQARCSSSFVALYHQLNKPEEATFCDSESLQLTGPNIWAEHILPTSDPAPTLISTPTLTPASNMPTLSNANTPSHSPSPLYSPSPSPSPVTAPGSGRGTTGQAMMISLCATVGIFIAAGYCISPHRTRSCEEENEKSQTEKAPLVITDEEKKGEKESDPLLGSGVRF